MSAFEKAGYVEPSPSSCFVRDMISELLRARTKFPDQSASTTLIGLSEEVGELAEAFLDAYVIEPKYRKGKTYSDLRNEAIQVAVMAMRVALDCGLADRGVPARETGHD